MSLFLGFFLFFLSLALFLLLLCVNRKYWGWFNGDTGIRNSRDIRFEFRQKYIHCHILLVLTSGAGRLMYVVAATEEKKTDVEDEG